MKKFILLFIIVSFSVSAAPWLTNGIDPTHIDFFGDVTGDGISDVIDNGKCYRNTNNNENPIFEEYRDVFTFTNEGTKVKWTPMRIRDELYWNYYFQFIFISNCTFRSTFHSNKFISSKGNDITEDGLDDWISMRAGIVIINISTNMGWCFFPSHGHIPTGAFLDIMNL